MSKKESPLLDLVEIILQRKERSKKVVQEYSDSLPNWIPLRYKEDSRTVLTELLQYLDHSQIKDSIVRYYAPALDNPKIRDFIRGYSDTDKEVAESLENSFPVPQSLPVNDHPYRAISCSP